jgi:hypothetical protein
MTVFAKYLAHHAVLKHLHGVAQERSASPRAQSEDSQRETDFVEQMKVDVSAVFPVELHELINQGFKAITKDIEQWREKAFA